MDSARLSITIGKDDVACKVASASRMVEALKETVGSTVDQYTTPEAALAWMLTNYEIIAGAVYAVAELLEPASRWLIDTEG